MEKVESKENIPTIETIRVAVLYKDKFLLLQKSNDSKNTYSLEFPGGGIDNISRKTSTLEEQIKSAKREVLEKTRINIDNSDLKKVEEFEIYFEVGKDENKQRFKKSAFVFSKIPDEQNLKTEINQTLTPQGKAEDNHQDLEWLTYKELKNKIFSTENGTKFVTRNSRYIKN